MAQVQEWSIRGGVRRLAAAVVLLAGIGSTAGLAVVASAEPAAAQTTTSLTATVPYTCSVFEVLGSVSSQPLMTGVAESLTATATVPSSVQAGEPFAVGLAGTVSLPPSLTGLLGGLLGPNALGTVTALHVDLEAAGATPATTTDSAEGLPFTATLDQAGSGIATTLAPVTLTAASTGPVTLNVGSLTAAVTLVASNYNGFMVNETCSLPAPVTLGSVPVVTTTPLPAVTSISPAIGTTAGGTTVTITGAGMSGATAVDFGTVPATSVTVDPTGTQLTATIPPGSGTVQVTVTAPGGITDGVPFTYVPRPTVSSISPTRGPALNDTFLTISGTGLTGATAVSLGATLLPFAVVDDTQIDAVAWPGTGTEPLTVTTPGGTSAPTGTDQFTYVEPPAITSLSPTTGPAAGGTTVTITGSGFTGATQVLFGFGTAPATFTVLSDTEITAITPPGEGVVSVQVQTPFGVNQFPLASYDQFTYSPPVVDYGTAVSYTYSCSVSLPAAGLAMSNQPVTLSLSTQALESVLPGQTFPIDLGGTLSLPASVDNALTALGDSLSITNLQLAVSADDATPAATDEDTGPFPAYPWIPLNPIVLTAGSPGTATVSAGALTIEAAVLGDFDETETLSITCSPPSLTLLASIPVTAGASPPTVTAISPASGPDEGGNTVTISGTGLSGTQSVYFNGNAATDVTVVSDTEVTATAPAPAPLIWGTVDVTVTTPGGTSAIVTADQYTYVPGPIVDSLTPDEGPLTGGTEVTIDGAYFTGATGVAFGSAASTSYTVVNDNQIVATVPPGTAPGQVNVTVTTPGGTNAAWDVVDFTYQPTPVVTTVMPKGTPANNGYHLTFIVGQNFTGATTVSFGTTPAPFAVLSSVVILAVAPPEPPGTVDVTVATATGGTSSTSPADHFTYSPDP